MPGRPAHSHIVLQIIPVPSLPPFHPFTALPMLPFLPVPYISRPSRPLSFQFLSIPLPSFTNHFYIFPIPSDTHPFPFLSIFSHPFRSLDVIPIPSDPLLSLSLPTPFHPLCFFLIPCHPYIPSYHFRPFHSFSSLPNLPDSLALVHPSLSIFFIPSHSFRCSPIPSDPLSPHPF